MYFSSQKSINDFSERWEGELHVLINNAATTPRQRKENEEGIEMQFAVNVLGYFRMIEGFRQYMKDSEDARIVNVASYWAGGLDLSDLEFKRRYYDNDDAYRQSKQANRMLTVAFAERLKEEGIRVNAAHPGDVNSKLSNDLGFGGHQSPEMGAETPVWLGVSADVSGITGKYFERKRQVHCPFSEDIAAIETLYSICQSFSS